MPLEQSSSLRYLCLDYTVLQIKTKIVSSHTADSKPVKQEVNSTVILPPLVFPGTGVTYDDRHMTIKIFI